MVVEAGLIWIVELVEPPGLHLYVVPPAPNRVNVSPEQTLSCEAVTDAVGTGTTVMVNVVSLSQLPKKDSTV